MIFLKYFLFFSCVLLQFWPCCCQLTLGTVLLVCLWGTLSQVQGQQIMFGTQKSVSVLSQLCRKHSNMSPLFACEGHFPFSRPFCGPDINDTEVKVLKHSGRTPNHVLKTWAMLIEHTCNRAVSFLVTFLRIGPKWCERHSVKTFCQVQEHQLVLRSLKKSTNSCVLPKNTSWANSRIQHPSCQEKNLHVFQSSPRGSVFLWPKAKPDEEKQVKYRKKLQRTNS